MSNHVLTLSWAAGEMLYTALRRIDGFDSGIRTIECGRKSTTRRLPTDTEPLDVDLSDFRFRGGDDHEVEAARVDLFDRLRRAALDRRPVIVWNVGIPY